MPEVDQVEERRTAIKYSQLTMTSRAGGLAKALGSRRATSFFLYVPLRAADGTAIFS